MGCFALGLSCLGLSGFLGLDSYFLPHFREVFNYYLLKYFLIPFLFVIFFWNTYDSNVGAFNIVPEVFEVILISFDSFSCFLSASFISTILSSTSLIISSASVILPSVPPLLFGLVGFCHVPSLAQYFSTFTYCLDCCV